MLDTKHMDILNPVHLSANLIRQSEADPSQLNGDLDLTSDEQQAYLKFHASRNRANSLRSRKNAIPVQRMPLKVPRDPGLASPARVMMDAFIRYFASEFTRYWGGRNIRVLDIGCGSGYGCNLLEQGGLKGEYIGVDHQPHPKFDLITSANFARRQIITDIHALEPDMVGSVDLLMSMTSLEHFEDDAAALTIARKTIGPNAAELHIVPAEEDALRLWQAHGWRQYSPACIQDLCPGADIYRIGGAASGFIHCRCITNPNQKGIDWRREHPGLYRTLRTLGLLLDPLTGNRPASLYAVVRRPGGGT